ncbi:uncharacterized protein HaLaN_02748 [Haematococcus lacustris]|uniref:Nucleolar protein 16 n=1 Tax=Haematococcus lacustris TaxID=44745 RepID=A0A699YCF1_HAELA|nr:uncharacterized protein HaLaN_02748 [Haematococcus lacustris]
MHRFKAKGGSTRAAQLVHITHQSKQTKATVLCEWAAAGDGSKGRNPRFALGYRSGRSVRKLVYPWSCLRIGLTSPADYTASWSAEETLSSNYQANHLMMDANQGFGRNLSSTALKTKEQKAELGEETYSDDDELRAGCNLERKSGKAAPPRLTATQRTVVQALVDKHGENVQAMVLDIKLNKMQHSAGQLLKLIAGLQHWKGPQQLVKHDFRTPQKPFKRL